MAKERRPLAGSAWSAHDILVKDPRRCEKRLFSSLMTLLSDEMRMRLEKTFVIQNRFQSHTVPHGVLEEQKGPERPGRWRDWQKFCKKMGKVFEIDAPDLMLLIIELRLTHKKKRKNSKHWSSCPVEGLLLKHFSILALHWTSADHAHVSVPLTNLSRSDTGVQKFFFGGAFYSCGSREPRRSLQSFLFRYVEIIMESPAYQQVMVYHKITE